MKNTIQYLIIALLTMLPFASSATRRGDDSEARQLFEKVYTQVFGPEGCTLSYDINLIGLYKSHGTIWMKQKKSKFTDDRVDSWNDGETVHAVYRKKKVVEVYSPGQEKYSSKFKFTLDDFDYTMERSGDIITFRLKQKHGAKGTVKEARAIVDAATLAPRMIKIKVALFWANIKISNFQSGNISDALFIFPKDKYGSDYQYIDKR